MKIVRARRAAGRRRLGLLDIRDRALVRRRARQTRRHRTGPRARHLAGVRRAGAVLRRRRPRSGRCEVVIDAANGMAGAMLPPVLERLPIDAVRCYFEPDGTFPNHEPNPLLPENREFIVAQDARGGRRPRRRLRRRRRPLLLRRRHGRVRPRRLRHRAPRRVDAREGARRRRSSTTSARAGPCRETIERAGGVAARQPRRPRLHQAPHARGGRGLRRRGLGPLLLPRLLPGRLGRHPVPAHARADLAARARSSPRSCAPFRERYFLTGELNTPVRRRRR